ncbi:MAG: hypothetical protein ABL904_23850, partial [Hyphomicrobiaceae bacterium]
PVSPPIPANDTAAAFGPYARYQPPVGEMPQPSPREASIAQWSDELARREAEVSVRAVEPPSQPQSPLPENVVVMPVRTLSPEPRGVDVEMTRETIRYTLPAASSDPVTFSVPTTAAVLPAALARLAMAGRFVEHKPSLLTAEPVTQDDVIEIGAEKDFDATGMATRLVVRDPAD